jgi:hypothetical protein
VLGNKPFPHVIAHNVFTPPVYHKLERAFQDVLARGLSDVPDQRRLARIGGHDIYLLSFLAYVPTPFGIFSSPFWSHTLAALFDVHPTGDVSLGLHHHCVGSASGSLHHDLNPGWFVDAPNANGINLLHPQCNYQTGDVSDETRKPREVMRAVAMLFYLNNPPWSAGDGGATGLYRSRDDAVDEPVAIVPPINNSMLVFECTPYSYHAFISNHRHPRDSVIMWLHRPKAEVVERWGEKHIVYWTR